MTEADQAYRGLTEGIHIAGYTLERAFRKLEWLLAENSRWTSVGGGFEDVNAFMDTIKLDTFKAIAEERKKIAASIKKLQPKVSNRKIAKVLGVDEKTVRNDAAEVSALTDKKASKAKGQKAPLAETSAPLTGAAAAKAVESKEINAKLDAFEQYMHDCGLYSIEDMRLINETRMKARWKLGSGAGTGGAEPR